MAGIDMEGVAFVDAVTGDPDNPVRSADKGHAVAFGGRDFGVDEDVLELLFAAETEGTEAVSWAAGADGEFAAGARKIEIYFVGPHVSYVGRNRTNLGGDRPSARCGLSWNRELCLGNALRGRWTGTAMNNERVLVCCSR